MTKPSTNDRRLFWVWCAMRYRCNNPGDKAFKNYGGRGISVCSEWLVYATFARDVGERPDGMLLDRIDNDGDYRPSNCRWATRTEQNRNRRNTLNPESVKQIRGLLSDGSLTHRAISEIYGVARTTISAISQNRNWST